MQDMELWEDVQDFEGFYRISSFGRVLSLRSRFKGRDNIYLKSWITGGYPSVELNKNGSRSTKLIHRLVAEHFIENHLNLPVVNHKNHNKLDYSLGNLEWCTFSENSLHSAHNADSVENIRLNLLVTKTLQYLAEHDINLDLFIKSLK